MPVHFGLGEAQQVNELQVQWPRGEIQKFEDIQVNRTLTINESSGIIMDHLESDPEHFALELMGTILTLFLRRLI